MFYVLCVSLSDDDDDFSKKKKYSLFLAGNKGEGWGSGFADQKSVKKSILSYEMFW